MTERWVPDKLQLRGVSWLVGHGGAGVLLPPGFGKTSITYAAIKTLISVKEAKRPFLVVAPLRPCYLVWPAEQARWTEFAGLRVEVLHGPEKNEALERPADVQVINPAGLPWLFERLRGRRFPWHGLAIDESTQFKHTNTKRFKILRPYLPLFKRRWILTGTPAPKGLLDLFGQIYVLDLGRALGQYVTHYRRKYFAPTGYGGYSWVPQEGAEAKIYAAIAPLVMRLDEADLPNRTPPMIGVFGEPRTRPNVTRVELPSKARATYDELETLFFTDLAEGVITAANSGVKSMKLSQAANGGVYLDKGGDEDADDVRARRGPRRWALIHDEKTEAVAELLDELSGKPALIVYDFHHDLERLRRHADLRNLPQLGGGNTPKEDAAIERAWNDEDLLGCFVNAQSIAHGLNLQRGGRAVIWHSLTWNWEHYYQLNKRVNRRGQRRRTYCYHVVATNTMDEAKIATLRAKWSTERNLLTALRAYAARRPTADFGAIQRALRRR